LGLAGAPLTRLQNPRGSGLLYSFDGKLDFLSEGDLIHVPKTEKHGFDSNVEITHVRKTIVAAFIESTGSSEFYTRELEQYAGRIVTKEDQFTIFEIVRVIIRDAYLDYCDADPW
jgi:hypothetical protein